MFAPFSSGYYVGRLLVEPHAGDDALMQRDQHERVNERLYSTGSGLERLDHPLVMKLRSKHFPVLGDDGVPDDTLLVPQEFAAERSLDPLPGIREVLLAKPGIVHNLFTMAGDGSDVVGR